MEIFQNQGIIQGGVAVFLVLAAWWVLRMVMGWIRRLSRLGCLAGGALLLVAGIFIRFS